MILSFQQLEPKWANNLLQILKLQAFKTDNTMRSTNEMLGKAPNLLFEQAVPPTTKRKSSDKNINAAYK